MNARQTYETETKKNKKNYPCLLEGCNFVTNRIDRLATHASTFDHDNMIWKNKDLICKHCGHNTISIIRMREHLGKHHSKRDK